MSLRLVYHIFTQGFKVPRIFQGQTTNFHLFEQQYTVMEAEILIKQNDITIIIGLRKKPSLQKESNRKATNILQKVSIKEVTIKL